jgi:hypothetical protein
MLSRRKSAPSEAHPPDLIWTLTTTVEDCQGGLWSAMIRCGNQDSANLTLPVCQLPIMVNPGVAEPRPEVCVIKFNTREKAVERFFRKSFRSSAAGTSSIACAGILRYTVSSRARGDHALCRPRNIRPNCDRDSGEFCLVAADSPSAEVGFRSCSFRLDCRLCSACHRIFSQRSFDPTDFRTCS